MQPHRRNLLHLIALGHAWTVLRRQGSSDHKSSYLTEIKDNCTAQRARMFYELTIGGGGYHG